MALVFVPFGAPQAAAVKPAETSRIVVCAAPLDQPTGLAPIPKTHGSRLEPAAVPVVVCFRVAVDDAHFAVR
jgi:hypothetical protein